MLFHVAFGLPFAIFLLRNFFTGIPRDLIGLAAVAAPVAKPAIASLTIFQFLRVWNDMLVALVIADQDSVPITVALRAQLRQFGTNIDLLATGAFLSMIVPLAVFLVFQAALLRPGRRAADRASRTPSPRWGCEGRLPPPSRQPAFVTWPAPLPPWIRCRPRT
ncbi:hypothetical protein GCM10022267_14660 [Lentzea roselyniae]|uniref:Multiple sugar transport system permease protein n=1 Tax=Lentzea roselyniae TaxID=531940 RepID=A0ABP7AC79_9PSEU